MTGELDGAYRWIAFPEDVLFREIVVLRRCRSFRRSNAGQDELDHVLGNHLGFVDEQLLLNAGSRALVLVFLDSNAAQSQNQAGTAQELRSGDKLPLFSENAAFD